jgi:sporulation protein YlmC with PRC-barrel domain
LNGLTTLQEVSEVVNYINYAEGGEPGATVSNVVYDFSTGSIWHQLIGSVNTNFTADFINVPTDNNRAITTTIIIEQSVEPYIPNDLKVNGLPLTIKWAGGTASGTADKVDIVGFTFIRTGATWSQVLGQINTFY